MADDDDFLVNNPNDINPLFLMKRDEELAEDGDTPFSPPDGVIDHIDDTYQQADTGIDAHERYDEGIDGATEINLLDDDLDPTDLELLDDNETDSTSDDDDDIIEPIPNDTDKELEAEEEE